jgi:hypothetical protein
LFGLREGWVAGVGPGSVVDPGLLPALGSSPVQLDGVVEGDGSSSWLGEADGSGEPDWPGGLALGSPPAPRLGRPSGAVLGPGWPKREPTAGIVPGPTPGWPGDGWSGRPGSGEVGRESLRVPATVGAAGEGDVDGGTTVCGWEAGRSGNRCPGTAPAAHDVVATTATPAAATSIFTDDARDVVVRRVLAELSSTSWASSTGSGSNVGTSTRSSSMLCGLVMAGPG